MNPEELHDVTDNEWSATIAPGGTAFCQIQGDYFHIDELYRTSDSTSVAINCTLNERRPRRIRAGNMLQGAPGRQQIKKLTFNNNTASEVFIVVIFGNGICNFAPQITLQNVSVNLNQATIDAIVDGIVDGIRAPEEGNPSLTRKGEGTWRLSGTSGFWIGNVSATALDITLDGADFEDPVDLAPTEDWEVSANGRHDTLGDVVITVPAGGTVEISKVGGTIEAEP